MIFVSSNIIDCNNFEKKKKKYKIHFHIESSANLNTGAIAKTTSNRSECKSI